jgi:fermentation-respiration switch protein FrsA (DUF1100 family)
LGNLSSVRVDGRFIDGESPAEVVAGIAPSPVLVVHGSRDRTFPPTEAQILFQEAGDPKAQWIISGGGHAERLFHQVGRPTDRRRVDAFVDGLVGRITALLPDRSQKLPAPSAL